MNKKRRVRVRVAPSPTGFAHIGTLWMSLFNYAFARKNGGSFILRLDDTDIEREVEGAEQAIYKGLKWAGLSWDEGPDVGGKYGPYKQSEKLTIYKQQAEKLVSKNLAYKDGEAIRVRGKNKDIAWDDLKRGKVAFPGSEIYKDFVIIKSNGYPTYHFATVIDEIDMGITHVIRGDEHISNTPRQLLFYELLGVVPPKFAHIPTIRNKSGKKLSKRHDPVDISKYIKDGYLPDALVNFLCLIGWSHPEGKDIFGLDEFVSLFTLEKVQKSEPKLDTDKLDWVNSQYIQKMQKSKLVNQIHEFYESKYDKKLIGEIVPLVNTRIKTLADFENLAGFFFKKPGIDQKIFGKNFEQHLTAASDILTKVKDWELETINESLMRVVKNNSFKTGDFFMDLRIAITGKKYTPPINDSIVILGKKEALVRLKKAVAG